MPNFGLHNNYSISSAVCQEKSERKEFQIMTPLYGFVKIHRKLLRWGWYQDNVVKGVFLHILLTANFEDMSWQGRTIKRGQLITGTDKMAADLGFSRQQIRTALKKLISTGEITTETSNKFTIVTVTNWDEYQQRD